MAPGVPQKKSTRAEPLPMVLKPARVPPSFAFGPGSLFAQFSRVSRTTRMRFVIQVAKRGQASCKHGKCKQKIEKGVVRVGKVSPSPFREGSEMFNWFHLDCIFDQMKNPRANKLESLGDLEGLDALDDDQKKQVQELFDKLNAGDDDDDDDDDDDETPSQKTPQKKKLAKAKTPKKTPKSEDSKKGKRSKGQDDEGSGSAKKKSRKPTKKTRDDEDEDDD